MLSETRNCQNCKQEFRIEPEDFAFYEKMAVPAPTWCAECRAVRRFAFWNERQLFLKTDARTGKKIFSTFPEESPIKIYDHDYWWGDAWDPMQHGRAYDFSRPFFAQFYDLVTAVPRPSRDIKDLEHSDYCNNATGFKNCYLCFNGDDNENCLYSVGFRNSKDSMDVYSGNRLEQCYDVYSCDKNYRLFFSVEADENTESAFLRNCVSCLNCFGCVGLRNKQYHLWNKPYTKEDYAKKIKEYDLGSWRALEALRAEARTFSLRYPYRFAQIYNSENAIGDYIYGSRNVYQCFEAFEVENVRYCQNVVSDVKDAMDFTNWGDKSERVYESTICGASVYNIKFCMNVWPSSSDLTYCVDCHSSSNLFGCVGLRKKSYCIFNVQYTKAEYEELVSKIIAHMNSMSYTDRVGRVYRYGEFFPPEHSPFAYTESVGNDYLPMEKSAVIAAGFNWRDQNPKEYEITVRASDLPDHIRDVPDNTTKELIQCATCKKAYRMQAVELKYLRAWGIAAPRQCPSCRHGGRLILRNRFRWYERQCECAGARSANKVYQNVVKHPHDAAPCLNKFETTFAPEKSNIVYCEPCYQAEVA